MNWIIYTLKNPRTDEVRYVGFTSRTPDKRMRAHINDAVRCPNTYRARWILSLLSIGLWPVMESVECGSGDGWADAEKKWIAALRASGARLTNTTDGGDGTLGRVMSAEQRQATKDYWARISPAERSKRLKAARSRPTSKERSESSGLRWAALSPDARLAGTAQLRAALDPKVSVTRMNASMTPERLSLRAKKRWANMPPEKRAAFADKIRASITPERIERARLMGKANRKGGK
jgi:hypothetical protein